jgi:hypothetical protein
MVLSHFEECDTVHETARVICPKVGVGAELLRRWMTEGLLKGGPEGMRRRLPR